MRSKADETLVIVEISITFVYSTNSNNHFHGKIEIWQFTTFFYPMQPKGAITLTETLRPLRHWGKFVLL